MGGRSHVRKARHGCLTGCLVRLIVLLGLAALLFVVLISVILFMFIKVENPAMRLVIRLALIPVIAGISYEILRLAGRSDNIFMSLISAPGMFLQKLTTKEPDDDMIECAITAFQAVIPENEQDDRW